MKKILVGMIAIPLLIVFVVVWPYIYNYHIFSLAQLKNGISIGDQYASVATKFEQYQQLHNGKGELQVSIEKDQLFIYHVNAFDDCQLTITFGATGQVSKIAYIGD